MLWKFLKLQTLLDTLFDDGWCGLGLPEAAETDLQPLAELATSH